MHFTKHLSEEARATLSKIFSISMNCDDAEKEMKMAQYAALSKEFGVEIKNENQKLLLMAGAPKEIIEADKPHYLYKANFKPLNQII